MDNYFKDIPPLPPEIDIPDFPQNPVEPLVKVFKPGPWFVPGTLEVSEKDWITEEDS